MEINTGNKQELHQRLKNIILNTCNKVGCKDCGLKWDNGCSATELEAKIIEIEMME